MRLASQLTGWTLNVMTESDIQAKQQEETGDILQRFIDELEVDEGLAQVLVMKASPAWKRLPTYRWKKCSTSMALTKISSTSFAPVPRSLID